MSDRKRRNRQWRRTGWRVQVELEYAARAMSDNRDTRADLVAEGVMTAWLLPSAEVALAAEPLELQVLAGVAAMKAWMRQTRENRQELTLCDPTLSEEELQCSEEQAQSSWPVLLRAA